MTRKLTGGCQCGHVRYEITGAPLTFYICHCTECQKQSSSAFGMSMTVRRAETRIIQGEMKIWQRPTDSGNRLSCYFCPECGTRLFHARSGTSEIWNLKAGSLDDTSWLQPAGHIWTKSAQKWVHIPEHTLNYEAQPETKDALGAAWAKQQGGAD
ncbi:MAG: aldehyde-activating protein [Hyphomicrobiales bacterium]|nr:MAG: aldehyde-activating protein [Hyphomicrobiales bacterium]